MSSLRFYQIPALGYCGIEEADGFITRLLLGDEAEGECIGDESPVMTEAVCQLTEYAEGKRRSFTVSLRPAGTPFQQSVWAALQKIPWGEYRTYGQIAGMLDLPGGARAVGNAVGANPLPVFIPCHRVLAAGGGLGGFRLGKEWKEKLLYLEHIVIRGRKIENF